LSALFRLSNSESWVIVKGWIDRAGHFGKKPQGGAGVGEEDIARESGAVLSDSVTDRQW
jgi:hypothetical protein